MHSSRASGLAHRPAPADKPGMSLRRIIGALACTAALLLPAAAMASAPSGGYDRSVGTPEQIAWVRRAAGNFLAAEVAGNGAGACAVLNAPLRGTVHNRTCAQRWNARLSRLLAQHGARALLRGEQRAVGSAAVVVHGDVATVDLHQPLLGGASRFLWTENCWMLEG